MWVPLRSLGKTYIPRRCPRNTFRTIVTFRGNLGAVGPSSDPSFPAVDDWAEGIRSFEVDDVVAFSRITSDFNAIHDPEKSGAICHGLLVASLIPTVFAHAFPGAVYRSQTLTFKV